MLQFHGLWIVLGTWFSEEKNYMLHTPEDFALFVFPFSVQREKIKTVHKTLSLPLFDCLAHLCSQLYHLSLLRVKPSVFRTLYFSLILFDLLSSIPIILYSVVLQHVILHSNNLFSKTVCFSSDCCHYGFFRPISLPFPFFLSQGVGPWVPPPHQSQNQAEPDCKLFTPLKFKQGIPRFPTFSHIWHIAPLWIRNSTWLALRRRNNSVQPNEKNKSKNKRMKKSAEWTCQHRDSLYRDFSQPFSTHY